MKRILSFALALITILCFAVSCSKEEYRNDVGVDELKNRVVSVLDSEKKFKVIDTYIDDEFDSPETIKDKCDGYVFCASASASDVDEFAIFKVKNPSDSDAVKKQAELYMKNNKEYLESILNKYEPEEANKLDLAEVYIAGNYVFYHMMSSEDSVKAVNAFHGALVK